MNDKREKLWKMLQRVNALSDRVSIEVCQRIQTRTGLQELDQLFTLEERANVLFRRVYTRYNATLPEEDRT